MVVLLHRCRTARLILAAHLHISYAQDIWAAVYGRFTEGFCRCGHVCRCSLYVIALVTVELSARSCKSKRVQTSGEMRALAKSRCRQVRHGAWRSGEA